MKSKFFANPIQLVLITLFLATSYSLEAVAQTNPIKSKPNTAIETTPQTTSPPKQPTIKYTTYSFSVSGDDYGMSGQFTVKNSEKDKLDKSDLEDFQLNAISDSDQFFCNQDFLTGFEIVNGKLSFKCENKDGLASGDSSSRSGEIRIVRPNRFSTKSFSGYSFNIQKVAEITNYTQGFGKWCAQKNELVPATQKTVDRLLEFAGTKNCIEATYILQRQRSLYLLSREITDLQPISGLTNLTELFLSGNQISDVTPLSGLTNLKTLNLAFNQISDVKPLAGLTNLTELVLSGNQIKDVQSLCKMPKLSGLYLFLNPTSQQNCKF